MNQRAPAGLENTSQNHSPHDLLEGSRAYDESIEQLRNWRERIVHALLLATSIVGFAAVIFETLIIIPERNWGVLVVIVVSYLFVLGLTLARRLSFNVRAIAFLTVFYLIGVFDLSLSGLTGDGRVFLLAFPLLALVLMGRNAGLVATVLSLAAIVVVGGLMVSGVLELSFESSSRDLVPWISGLVIFILIAAAVIIPTNHVLNRLIAAMSSALEDAQRRWLEVRQLSRGLERQVADRTKELAQRSEKLEAAVEVARGVAAIRDLRQILDVTVHLISERFAFYHAGIFLIDEERAYAVLRAASSEGGRRMLARGHRLAVGAEGIVGHVAASGRPRIVSNVGEDAAFFDNPDLPYTRSEIALPLRLRDQVIGVLDVQSTQEQAFAPDDIAILQTMADQVAMAIENAQLLEQSERALRGLQATYGEYTRGALESMETFPAFEYDRVQVTPAAIRDDPGISRALEAGRPVTLAQAEGRASLVAPLRIRQQVVGAIALEEKRQDRPWTPDEIELVEAVSEQVAQALESASFYQMEQRRRRVSDTLREITRVVGSTLDLNEVIERLLDQLATLIPFDMVSIQLLQDGQRELIGGRGFDLEAARAS
ncbi:MAG: GAF domain-containing protein, partial [Anaerolineae bacterium]|nr:GAF domain-containing protein [Anaerolineae bacterium]